MDRSFYNLWVNVWDDQSGDVVARQVEEVQDVEGRLGVAVQRDGHSHLKATRAVSAVGRLVTLAKTAGAQATLEVLGEVRVWDVTTPTRQRVESLNRALAVATVGTEWQTAGLHGHGLEDEAANELNQVLDVVILAKAREVDVVLVTSLVTNLAGRVVNQVICQRRAHLWGAELPLPSEGARWGVETPTVAGLLGR